jgi:predicted esterase
MKELLIETPTHGRVLVVDAVESPARGTIVGFHGYGQSADTMLSELQRIPGASRWRLVSVQALNRFYTRGDESVVASWMTRQDRDAAIADNIEYINRAIDAVLGADQQPLVYLGFSQGASTASRIAARGRRRATGLVLLGGDIAPEIKTDSGSHFLSVPVLLGAGSRDTWYQPRLESDLKFLRDRGGSHQVVRFDGGHEFTDEFRSAVGAWISALSAGSSARD